MYKLTITKTEPNPNYKEEMKEYNNRGMYSRSSEHFPEKEKIVDTLVVELTDEEYKKVKAEVIKVFE